MRSLLRILAAALAAAAATAPAAHAGPAAPPETVLQDDAMLLHGGDHGVRDSMVRLRALGVDRVRLTAGWSVIAPSPDSATVPEGFDATDPAAYPRDAWNNLDRAVREAHAAGLKIMIDIAFWAPRWATKEQASEQTRLRTHIDPDAYARFSTAVARRYAGGYRPPHPDHGDKPEPDAPDRNFLEQMFGVERSKPPRPSGPDPLPAVDVFTIWNEPNHPGFMQPQWERRDGSWWPASADAYRAMVRASYPAIKAAAPSSTVLIGGTASGGSAQPGSSGVPPLWFLRALACVDDNYQPITTGSCANYTTLPGDGWSHHPYSLRTAPEAETRSRDKLPVASTPRLLAALRRLVRSGRLSAGNDQLWQTEYGYETGPPDPQAPFGPEVQADLLARAERIGTADPAVRSWPQFLLRDRPGAPAGPRMREFGDWQSGLEYADGSPKPAYAAFRLPAVAVCRTGVTKRMVVWGRWRGVDGATAQLQRRTAAGRWADVGRPVRVRRASAPVALSTAWRGGAQARLRWTAPGGSTAETRALSPVACPRAAAASKKSAKSGGGRRSMRGSKPASRGKSSRVADRGRAGRGR